MENLQDVFASDFEAGQSACTHGMSRAENPHLKRAIMWDKGWTAVARAEYAKTNADTKVVSFKEWIALQ